MKFYVTTVAGIEDVVSKEIESLGGKIIEVRKGKVFFEGKENLIPKVNFFSRCSERMILLLYNGKFSDLNDIYVKMRGLDYCLLKDKTFAIRSSRAGEHDFTSLDVSRYAGQAVIDSFLEGYGKRLKVNLDEPDVIIRVDVVGDEFFVGIDTTGDDALHKRWWRIYNHPAHLNTTIACAMLKIAGWRKKERLIDPMCGSGTIPIEAALMGRGIPIGKNRKFAYFNFLEEIPKFREDKSCLDIHGMEKFENHLKGAMENARSARVEDTINFSVGDATRLRGSYDCIVTNPPYGLRIGSKKIIRDLYERFVFRLKECMHDSSRAVIITTEGKLLEDSVKKASLHLLHERPIECGGLRAKIFVVTL